jgi:hypothetical protein
MANKGICNFFKKNMPKKKKKFFNSKVIYKFAIGNDATVTIKNF